MFRKCLLFVVCLAVALAVSDPPASGYSVLTATCYQLPGTAADGTAVYPGMVAHNFLAPGTRVTLSGNGVKAFFGRRRFTVHDTGPALADGHLDVWRSGGCSAWGVRSVRLSIGWPEPRVRGWVHRRARPAHTPWLR